MYRTIVFETSRGVLHGTKPKSLGGGGKTLCNRPLGEGWKYRGHGIPTCRRCLGWHLAAEQAMHEVLYRRELHKKNPKCARCGITRDESDRLPAVATGIDHPEYCFTKSFYLSQNTLEHHCPRCHRELDLESCFKAMDDCEKRTGKNLEYKPKDKQ